MKNSPMLPRLLAVALVAATAACAGHRPPAGGAPSTSTGRGAVATGSYPNLFTSLLGVPDAEVQAKIDAAWQQYFYGNDSTQRLYYPVGQDMAYILNPQARDVRTEGMSYGMMIAVQLDRKAEFDRIWKWAKTYMEHRTGQRKGYFAWQLRPDGTIIDQTPAPDGEEWFVTALFFASSRWGDGEGIFNYRAEAQKILDTMLHKEVNGQPVDSTTNMFDPANHLVRFVPNLEARSLSLTDPSYHLPHFFEMWARWADRDNAFWCDAAAASRRFLRQAANPVTGLTADYTTFDGTPKATWWNRGADAYRFDSFRVAGNVGVDYAWFASDTAEVGIATRQQDFFWGQGIDRYVNQYSVDGRPEPGAGRSSGQWAMNGVASLASASLHRADFVRALWTMNAPSGLYRYYDGLLYTLGLLEVGGRFKAYGPGRDRMICR